MLSNKVPGLVATVMSAVMLMATSPFAAAAEPQPRAAEPVNLSVPVVTGEHAVLQVLTSTVGTWSVVPDAFTTQWFADDDPIGSPQQWYMATPTYPYGYKSPDRIQISMVVPAATAGRAITIRVTPGWTQDGPETASSAPTAPVVESTLREAPLPSPQMDIGTVACSAPSSCFATEMSGGAPVSLLKFDGVAWSAHLSLQGMEDAQVDCAADGFCMLVVGRHSGKHDRVSQYRYATLRSGVWSSFRTMPATPVERTRGISWAGVYYNLNCASARFCAVAMGGRNVERSPSDACCGSGGWIVTWKPKMKRPGAPAQPWMLTKKSKKKSEWSAPTQATSKSHLYAFDCASPRSCLVMDSQTSLATPFNPKTGKISRGPTNRMPFMQDAYIGCVSESMCLATTDSGGSRIWDGRQWGKRFFLPRLNGDRNQPQTVSCHAGASCVAIGQTFLPNEDVTKNYFATVFHLSGDQWDNPQILDEEGASIYAEGESGSIDPTIFKGPTFTGKQVDCPSVDYCIAAADGQSYVFTP